MRGRQPGRALRGDGRDSIPMGLPSVKGTLGLALLSLRALKLFQLRDKVVLSVMKWCGVVEKGKGPEGKETVQGADGDF